MIQSSSLLGSQEAAFQNISAPEKNGKEYHGRFYAAKVVVCLASAVGLSYLFLRYINALQDKLSNSFISEEAKNFSHIGNSSLPTVEKQEDRNATSKINFLQGTKETDVKLEMHKIVESNLNVSLRHHFPSTNNLFSCDVQELQNENPVLETSLLQSVKKADLQLGKILNSSALNLRKNSEDSQSDLNVSLRYNFSSISNLSSCDVQELQNENSELETVLLQNAKKADLQLAKIVNSNRFNFSPEDLMLEWQAQYDNELVATGLRDFFYETSSTTNKFKRFLPDAEKVAACQMRNKLFGKGGTAFKDWTFLHTQCPPLTQIRNEWKCLKSSKVKSVQSKLQTMRKDLSLINTFAMFAYPPAGYVGGALIPKALLHITNSLVKTIYNVVRPIPKVNSRTKKRFEKIFNEDDSKFVSYVKTTYFLVISAVSSFNAYQHAFAQHHIVLPICHKAAELIGAGK